MYTHAYVVFADIKRNNSIYQEKKKTTDTNSRLKLCCHDDGLDDYIDKVCVRPDCAFQIAWLLNV